MRSVQRLVAIVCVITCVNGCGRPSRPRDTNPPVFDDCPTNIRKTADPIQVNTKVYWDEPTTQDHSAKVVRNGLPPGKLFSGITTISYSARDRAGNFASCSFAIIVEVIRCKHWTKIDNGYRWCHLSHDMRLGTRCQFGCYEGHELDGSKDRECLHSWQWDDEAQPSCRKVQCETLSSRQNDVDIKCSDSNNYRSVCSYICKPGFSILPGFSHVRLCGSSKQWVGATPNCVDTSPPRFTNCPSVRTAYAESLKTYGRVSWPQPRATDNVGQPFVVQTKGPTSGSDLEVGEYDVSYIAYDGENNTATCDFKVVVKQIRCPVIFPLPYTVVTCPTGRLFGSSCEFSCQNGSSLTGHNDAICSKSEETEVKYGKWSFENAQPYCELDNTCPNLSPPANGALACDTWLAGKYCQMLCQEGYAVDDPGNLVHKTLLVCGDNGDWIGGKQIPDCLKRAPALWEFVKIGVDYLYYTGECSSDREDIKQAFLTALTKGAGFSCEKPSCDIGNVNVQCGDTSFRRKREADLRISLSLTLSPTDSSSESLRRTLDIRNELQSSVESSELDVIVNGHLINVSSVDVSTPELVCAAGSAPNGGMLQCVKCSLGFFHNATENRCQKCPRGYFQDAPGQKECIKCPNSQTTTYPGSTSMEFCVASCPVGHFSVSGTPPCSPCDIGSFADMYGTIECIPCPGSQTTILAGSTSKAACHHFDLTFPEHDSNITIVPATILDNNEDIHDSFELSLWFRCQSCDHILEIKDETDNTLMALGNGTVLELNKKRQTTNSIIDVSRGRRWTYIRLVYSEDNSSVVVDNQIVISGPGLQLPAHFTVTLGGDGFIGSISQFNMWKSASRSTIRGSCFEDGQGDIVSWKQFVETDGSFIRTRSTCDAYDNCRSDPCRNGGICTDLIDDFSCDCPPGFEGNSCDIDIDDCQYNVCENGATCIDDNNFYRCECNRGFKGEFCEIMTVDGHWSPWEQWSECSVTCGAGIQLRERICGDPEPDNGGLPCVGDATETQECVMDTVCINECFEEPTTLANGTLNCVWVDEDNDTRVCKPTCDPGFDFDSDLFVDQSMPITCGLQTGYTWSIRNPDNPEALLPSCTEIKMANANILEYSATYPDLEIDNSNVQFLVNQRVNLAVQNTTCIKTEQCGVEEAQLSYLNSSNGRTKRAMNGVSFTIQIKCTLYTGFRECYDHLAEVVAALNHSIADQELSIIYVDVTYDVDATSVFLDGTSVCKEGMVPIMHYCVPCGPGSFQTGEFCDRCPRGTYQDIPGQSYCKDCPKGWSTAGLQGRDTGSCSVQLPAEKSSIIVPLAVSITVVVVIAILGGFLVLLKMQIKTDRTFMQILKQYPDEAQQVVDKKTFQNRIHPSGDTPKDNEKSDVSIGTEY